MSSHASVFDFSSFLLHISQNAKSSWRLASRGSCAGKARIVGFIPFFKSSYLVQLNAYLI